MTKLIHKETNSKTKIPISFLRENSHEITPALDKLALLQSIDINTLETSKLQNLKKRAKAKYITNALTNQLRKLDSPLRKSYVNTFFCTQTIVQNKNVLTSTYCNNRWCVVCNRIRTAKLINKYSGEFEKFTSPYFVTLTIPNVRSVKLKETIEDMVHTFRGITNYVGLLHRRGSSQKLTAIRKTEVTYNNVHDTFHPHFHIIVDSKEIAEHIVEKWLSVYTNAVREAQDIRIATKGSLVELFKYTTKIITSRSNQKISVDVRALDIIYRALYRKRTFQTYGITAIDENIEELESEIYEELEYNSIIWVYERNDWINHETGEVLTNYEPNEFDTELVKSMVLRL